MAITGLHYPFSIYCSSFFTSNNDRTCSRQDMLIRPSTSLLSLSLLFGLLLSPTTFLFCPVFRLSLSPFHFLHCPFFCPLSFLCFFRIFSPSPSPPLPATLPIQCFAPLLHPSLSLSLSLSLCAPPFMHRVLQRPQCPQEPNTSRSLRLWLHMDSQSRSWESWASPAQVSDMSVLLFSCFEFHFFLACSSLSLMTEIHGEQLSKTHSSHKLFYALPDGPTMLHTMDGPSSSSQGGPPRN